MGFSLGSLAPILGTGLGALFAAPTGGMSMGAGALIGGLAGSGVSSAMSADAAIDAGKEANAANIDMQRETNAMEIELANTAHQREVADLKAAGLNPILSAKLGGSAIPIIQSPSMASLAPIIQNSAGQMNEVMQSAGSLANQFALQRSQVALNSATAIKTAADAQKVMYENDARQYEMQKTAYEEKRRSERPAWIKNIGIDVQDTIGTVLAPVGKLFK